MAVENTAIFQFWKGQNTKNNTIAPGFWPDYKRMPRHTATYRHISQHTTATCLKNAHDIVSTNMAISFLKHLLWTVDLIQYHQTTCWKMPSICLSSPTFGSTEPLKKVTVNKTPPPKSGFTWEEADVHQISPSFCLLCSWTQMRMCH